MTPTPAHLKHQRPGTIFGIFVPLSEEEAEDLLLNDEDEDGDGDEESEESDDEDGGDGEDDDAPWDRG
jgi:hypothetical protein